MRVNKEDNWNKWYAAVILVLLLQIVLYYLFTRHWS